MYLFDFFGISTDTTVKENESASAGRRVADGSPSSSVCVGCFVPVPVLYVECVRVPNNTVCVTFSVVVRVVSYNVGVESFRDAYQYRQDTKSEMQSAAHSGPNFHTSTSRPQTTAPQTSQPTRYQANRNNHSARFRFALAFRDPLDQKSLKNPRFALTARVLPCDCLYVLLSELSASASACWTSPRRRCCRLGRSP